ncbi:hypothetical protein OKW38_005113 [Paraburkholderia sp. MM5496-R1]|uniref:hypothetical protein n=1 Tax=Paraburkholderia sp. MM5496-R1 TaxID=2991065 RepID=UPI003D2084E8
MLLALKLVLVPAFLAALTAAARVWGPSVAGWLAGLPVVAGPIMLLLAVERGPAFAAVVSVVVQGLTRRMLAGQRRAQAAARELAQPQTE